MGKGTDKLYITHSEWASADAFGASKGAGGGPTAGQAAGSASGASRRLPFGYCAASLQPFAHPVCTPEGTVFDAEAISAWFSKQEAGKTTNPVTGAALRPGDLIRLVVTRNDADGSHDLIDPVTFKVLTEHTHVIALRHGSYANVFAWDTVQRMNIAAKMWQDLVDDVPFTRKDIITLQDPQNPLATGAAVPVVGAQGADRTTDKVQRAKEVVAKARRAREAATTTAAEAKTKTTKTTTTTTTATPTAPTKRHVDGAAVHTTGRAAASFTSTGLTPETSGARAELSDEEWLLRPRRVKTMGYAKLVTGLGDVTVALAPEHAPRAVWNFVRLAQQGYYRETVFHRNLARFMVQGGDPTGTGRGGKSVWGTPFADELGGPRTHSSRGVVSMANKGRNTNGSQFFITYRAAPHLDRKHTIFGQVVDGLDVLDRLETAAERDKDVKEPIQLHDVVVLVDPFAEFLAEQAKSDAAAAKQAEIVRQGGTEDDKVTWTGKRIQGMGPRDGGPTDEEGGEGVGKYLTAVLQQQQLARPAEEKGDDAAAVDAWEEPARKKAKAGGFGNFDSW